jgi:hypothetical protein
VAQSSIAGPWLVWLADAPETSLLQARASSLPKLGNLLHTHGVLRSGWC